MNPELVTHWSNEDDSPNDFIRLRLYMGGEFTGERYVNGVAQGEVTLEPQRLSVVA